MTDREQDIPPLDPADWEQYRALAHRMVDESLDRTCRIGRSLARDDEAVALLFSTLGERRSSRAVRP